MKGELLRRAAFARDDEHVHVAVTRARERDPAPIRREARVGIPGDMHGEPSHVGAGLVCRPDVPEIAERDSTVVVVGMAKHLRLPNGRRERDERDKHKG